MRAFTWRSFRRSGATTLHTHNVPLKVQQDIMGHADPDVSLLYTEADLDQRRKAIELLEQTVFAVQNEKTDATWTQVADKMSPGRVN